MRLNSLHLVNFRQHAESRIEFDLGLTGIIGPNGGGKTTILEAIAWALYGQPAARGHRDSIRFQRAGARAPVRVELDFELAGHRYRVVRGLTSAELYLDGGEQPIASSITGVSELLQRRLGMTRAEFFHTYFTGQKELNVMAAMAPTERAQFLSRVLGYDRLRTAQAMVREQRRLISAEITGLRSALPDADAVARLVGEARERLAAARAREATVAAQQREADAAFATIGPQWRAAQEAREALQALLSELRVAEGDETARARELGRVDGELREIRAARTELEQLAALIAPLNEVLEEFRRLDELAREEGRRQTLVESGRALDEELSRLQVRHALIIRAPHIERELTEKLARKRTALDETTALADSRRTEWVRDRQEAETKRDALRRQWGELKAQYERIVDLGEEGICPTCTRVLGTHYRTVLDQLQEQLDTIQVDGRYFSTRLDQMQETPDELKALDAQRRTLSQEVATLERQVARAQSASAELDQLTQELAAKNARRELLRRDLDAIPSGFDAGRHEALGREVARLAPLNERVTRLSGQIEREASLAGQRERALRDLEAVRTTLAALRARYDASKFSEEEYASLRTRHDEAASACHAAVAAAAAVTMEVGAAAESLASAERSQREMERARERFDGLLREKRLHDELDRAFTDLRTDLNLQLRPELSDLASGFLSELTEGRYSELELDDQYNVQVLEDGIPKPVISGGEEDLSNLVLRLAISQMIAERAGQSFSLLVLDEVFGSLDEARRHNVVELLRRLQDRFEQVILISHIETVRDELDHVIRVSYDEQTGASVVRQWEGSAVIEPVSRGETLAEAGAPGT